MDATEKRQAYYQREELQEIMSHAFLCVEKIIEERHETTGEPVNDRNNGNNAAVSAKKRVCARGLEWLVDKRAAELKGQQHIDLAKAMPLALLQEMVHLGSNCNEIAAIAREWNKDSAQEARQRGKKDAKAVLKLQKKELMEKKAKRSSNTSTSKAMGFMATQQSEHRRGEASLESCTVTSTSYSIAASTVTTATASTSVSGSTSTGPGQPSSESLNTSNHSNGRSKRRSRGSSTSSKLSGRHGGSRSVSSRESCRTKGKRRTARRSRTEGQTQTHSESTGENVQ